MGAFCHKLQGINRETNQGISNHHFTERNHATQSNRVEGSVLRSSSVNNWGAGSQFNNEGGSQNVVTGGVSIAGSVFNGNVNIGIEKEECRAEILQKLCAWLQSSHIADECYDNSIHRKMNDTCNWILDNPEFTSWRSESSPSPKWLWIHGLPAFGQTVLCARIIGFIKDEKKEAVAYYFSPDLESHRDPMIAMRSWLYHMALMNVSVLDVVNKKRKQNARASQAVIMGLFREAIKMVLNCTLVVNGLDECEPGSFCLSVADFVKEIDEAVLGTNARILVMSRSESSIHQALMKVKGAEFLQYKVCEKDIGIDALSGMIEMETFLDEKKPPRVMRRKWFDLTSDDWVHSKGNPPISFFYAIELGFVNLATTIFKKGKGCGDLARELVAIGAKVGIKEAQGRAAIRYAALDGYKELVEPLIDHGADITI
ncbi:hypothetical protein FP744_10005098 [Trichoderma asperellum]